MILDAALNVGDLTPCMEGDFEDVRGNLHKRWRFLHTRP